MGRQRVCAIRPADREMPQTTHIQSAIEALLLDEDGIGQIETRFGGFNIFEAIRHTRAEERHSDFLAFLLDPKETHGLGAEFLVQFLVTAVKAISSESRPLSLGDIVLKDFSGCLVLRERHNIDVLCIDETHRFLLAIENKVDSGEHSDQLVRYRQVLEKRYGDFRRVLVYLTPETDDPSDENWLPVGYRDVLSIIESLAGTHGESLGEAVGMTLHHYARMLRRNIVMDDNLVELAKAVYRKHKVALDFIFEQTPDDQLERSEFSRELVSKERKRIELVRGTKSTVNFFPVEWKQMLACNATPADLWTKSGHSLLFEIRNARTSIKMCLVIGPSENETLRQDMLKFAQSKPTLFPGCGKKLYDKYTTIFSRHMIEPATLDQQPVEKIKHDLESWFQKFMDSEFREIVGAISEEFAEVGES